MEEIILHDHLTNTQLLNIVAEYYEIPPDLVLSQNKDREVADARFIYYRLLKDKGYTLKYIGKITGGRTHGTVSAGLAKVGYIPELIDAYNRLNSIKFTRIKQLQNKNY